jgi:formate hydrogenlyase subunit 3/multisubunit Na+/H+ antiporter MnhD subunit
VLPSHINILLMPVLLPIIAGVIVWCLPGRLMKAFRELFSLLVLLASFIYTIDIFLKPIMPFKFKFFQLQGLVFNFDLGVNRFNAFVLMFSVLFALLIAIYSLAYMSNRSRSREYFSYLLITAGTTAGALLSQNLLALLIFWEMAGLMLYLLVAIGPDPKKADEAATKTMSIVGLADLCLLLGVVLVYIMTGTFELGQIRVHLGSLTSYTAYVLLMIGALAKAGAIPFHTWIPAAAEGAATPVMALLPASLDKLLGIYLLALISLKLFAVDAYTSMLLMIIGAVTIMAAVVMALVQKDLKKLLAYHAVSQVGYMVLGIGTGVAAGIAGGVFHMLNHAVYKSCLFLCAGSVEEQAGTTDLAKLGGLAKLMPITFMTCLIAAFSISGVPPFNGFVSKWMIYQGIFTSKTALWPIFLLAAMFGSALTLASFLKVIFSVFLGERSPGLEKVKESNILITAPLIVLASICVLFGIFSQLPLHEFIGPALGMSMADLALSGTWVALTATGLLITGLVIGLLIYLLGNVKAVKTSPSYFGGEPLKAEDMNIAGTHFYDSRGSFDIYYHGKKITAVFTQLLKNMHQGYLNTYLSWSLFGLVILILIMNNIR